MPDPVIRQVDCLRLPVDDLKEALAFYRDNLGHEPIGRPQPRLAYAYPDSSAELVIQTEGDPPEIDLTVKSVDEAIQRFMDFGRHPGDEAVRDRNWPLSPQN
jgi:catechol 2,3-dioxygenase-like lactoylglutathione lyase family enzyme